MLTVPKEGDPVSVPHAETVDLPINYRCEIVAPLMQRLLAGESCAIVGIAGTGKSNLVGLLARPDVQAHYLGAAHADFLFVRVDFNRLAEASEWGFWELLLHRLVTALSDDATNAEPFARLAMLHEQAAVARDPVVAQRRFETAVAMLGQTPGRRLVFLFDQFDEAWRTLPGEPFRVLRALRDEFKYRLAFVVSTRDELSRLRADLSSGEDFYELVVLNTYGLGPHSEADARNQVARLNLRRGAALPEDQVAPLLHLSGRHPGLLRAAYWALADARVDTGARLLEQLAADRAVRKTCAEIWRSLDDDECALLRKIVHGHRPADEDREVSQLLQLKGLLTPASADIFSQLFAACIRQTASPGPHVLSLDPVSGRVEIDGLPPADELTKADLALLTHLYERRGKVCSRHELMQVLHPGEATMSDPTDRRLDTQVRRLRAKIEPDRDHPLFIITVRDRGYKLVTEPALDADP